MMDARLDSAIPGSALHLVVEVVVFLTLTFYTLFALLHRVAPKPRAVLPSEKTFVTVSSTSDQVIREQLPCWYDHWLATRRLHEARVKRGEVSNDSPPSDCEMQPAELAMSVVIPAFNEEERILPTLKEAVQYLDKKYGRCAYPNPFIVRGSASSSPTLRPANAPALFLSGHGYEIIIVNDGSNDKTVEVALNFAREEGLNDVLRVVTLEKNRGKGGSVTHGMRHVRGAYVLFADADGATRFSDLAKLVEGCEKIVDCAHRGVAIGSRAHLVGSEAVVKRSALRNFLMRSFHLVLMILTPPATSRIRDTQCGFKLFTRAALPDIIPYMHAEGWIFDIEMLMLAESAPAVPVLGYNGTVIGSSPGIKVAEVPIDWHEVSGSKLNVIQDSIKMAIGLAVLRASWMMGVYRRRLT